MQDYIFENGRVRFINDKVEITKIKFGYETQRSFEKAFMESYIDYNDIYEVVVREATLFRKGSLQIITHSIDQKRIRMHYQVNNDPYALMIRDRKMNEVAIEVKRRIEGKEVIV